MKLLLSGFAVRYTAKYLIWQNQKVRISKICVFLIFGFAAGCHRAAVIPLLSAVGGGFIFFVPFFSRFGRFPFFRLIFDLILRRAVIGGSSFTPAVLCTSVVRRGSFYFFALFCSAFL
jgi:hypothetical protein